MNKKLVCAGIMILMTLTLVSAKTEASLIKTNLKVSFDILNKEKAILKIEGENLEWTKTIYYNTTRNNATNSTDGLGSGWVQNIELNLIRELGNITDALYKIEECNNLANFSKKWVDCVELNNILDEMMINKMVNKTHYNELNNNLTKLINNWENSYLTEKTKNEDCEKALIEKNTWMTRSWWIAGISLAGVGWFGYKFGWFRRKSSMEKEYPRDVSV